MESLRVLYSTNVKLPAGDAQSKQIYAMAEAFSSISPHGNFTLVSPAFPEQKNLSTPFAWWKVRLPRPSRLRYLVFFLIQPFLFWRNRPDLVFTRDILVALASVLCGVSVCFEIHKAPKRSAAVILRAISRSKKLRIVAISSALKKFLETTFEFPEDRVFVAHDAVKKEAFARLATLSKSQLRRELGLPLEKLVIVHPGRAAAVRGFGLIQSLMASHHDFLLLQIGGSESDTAFWKAKYAGDPRLVFLPSQNQTTVFKYQAAADLGLFFLTKQTETWWCCSPLKIFEYMAAGTPILSSGIGSVTEVLNENNAILFDPEDPQALEKGFRFFLENPEEVDRRRLNALKSPAAQTSWEQRCEAILRFEKSVSSANLGSLVAQTP